VTRPMLFCAFRIWKKPSCYETDRTVRDRFIRHIRKQRIPEDRLRRSDILLFIMMDIPGPDALALLLSCGCRWDHLQLEFHRVTPFNVLSADSGQGVLRPCPCSAGHFCKGQDIYLYKLECPFLSLFQMSSSHSLIYLLIVFSETPNSSAYCL